MRDFHQPGRSPVLARNGMAATSHPMASAAAVDTLKQGGNAVDAAIAAAAVLAVVEPHMTSIGGDCFALIAKNDGTLFGLNGSGRAAQSITTENLLAEGITEIPEHHGLAVTVPGSIDAWSRLLKAHGRFGLDRVLAPAIDLARSGVPVSARVASDWAGEAPDFKDAGIREHYLNASGQAPGHGEVMTYPALADTLAVIAEQGPDGFYKGRVGEEICKTVQAAGGYLTEEDLAAVAADEVTPITTGFRDRKIAELPPSTQGITALLMLAILERFDPPVSAVSGERYHLQMEAARLAYALRDRFLSDPDTADISVERLLDAGHIDALAARIDPKRRMDDAGAIDPRGQTDTVYLSVVDEDRMAVSFINSLYGHFGSRIATPKSGVLLQNRGACFVVEKGHPNTIEGGKRPLHTLIPGMMLKGEQWDTCFGVMGGQYQACGHAQFTQNVVDFGMDPQEALDCPRAFFDGDLVELETTIPEKVADSLKARGHQVSRAVKPHGGGQAIRFDRENNVLIGGSDPRKDGCALGY